MLLARKARLAAVGALAAIILTGCANAPADTAEPSAATTAEVQTKPDDRRVTIVEVIDPVTLVVTPSKTDDALYGEEFTMHVTDIEAPAAGDCGFEEAVRYAEEALVGPRTLAYARVEPWIDDDGDHYGIISASLPYAQAMIVAGMATPTEAWRASYETNQLLAQEDGRGLWALCPDFGA